MPSVASADTIDLSAYRSRLIEARSLLVRARTAPIAERGVLVTQAATLLRQTTALRSGGETIALSDAPVADLLSTPANAERAVSILDAYIDVADRAARNGIDPALADSRLREIIGSRPPDAGGSVLTGIGQWIAARLAEWANTLGASLPDLRLIAYAVAGIGLAIVAFIVVTLGRGVRERIRREVVVADRATARADEPAEHLRLAELAASGGRAREAIHELYLYVIGSLAARELIRYDPALTDRELLSRAAAMPNVEALGELVALYERAWFGLREPDPAEAQRARSLASRVLA